MGALAKAKELVEQRLTDVPDEKREALEMALTNSMEEHFRFQQLQSQYHAMGKLSTEDAMFIYAALGEAPADDGWASGTDLATKVVVTEAMTMILKEKVGR